VAAVLVAAVLAVTGDVPAVPVRAPVPLAGKIDPGAPNALHLRLDAGSLVVTNS